MDSLPSLLGLDPELYWSVIFPIIIALSRVVDVILGTFRIILVIQGRKLLATLFGFFEVLIWISVAGQVMSQLNNFSYYLAWAFGFAAGTFIGMSIEERISLGMCILRIIIRDCSEKLIALFYANDINTTVVEARGQDSERTIVFSILPRKKLKFAEALIRESCPSAVYTIENIRSVHQGLRPCDDDKTSSYFRRVFPRGKSK